MRGLFAREMSVGDAVAWGATALDESDIRCVSSRADAMLLLRHVMHLSAAQLHVEWERQLTQEQTQQYNALLRRRQLGEPLQYILGAQEFFGLHFRVTPAVLIPRPETEHLVEAAITRLRDSEEPRILDAGTGSGAIAVALAHNLPTAHITAVDISAQALEVAEQNAKQNGVAERIRFVASDLLAAVGMEKFHAIVSNPPYIATGERKKLPVEVRDHEPEQALFAGKSGLEIIQRLVAAAPAALVAGGWLFMEIGYNQRDAVAGLLRDWRAVEFVADLQGIPRVAIGQRPD
jgi:release factor glutamine methyltransferase